MAEMVQRLPQEARRRALVHLAMDEVLPWELWRSDLDVAEVSRASGGLASNLRSGLDASLRELLARADPCAGLAATYIVQALVLAVLDRDAMR